MPNQDPWEIADPAFKGFAAVTGISNALPANRNYACLQEVRWAVIQSPYLSPQHKLIVLQALNRSNHISDEYERS